MPPCHRHMVFATNFSSMFLTCCFAVPLKRAPNVALSSPQSAVIACFLARLDRPTYLRPPLGRLGRHPRVAKSDYSTAGQLGPGLEPMFCGVCVQCISGLLLGRHQCNRFPNRPLPFPNLPPRGSNCPSVHISKNRSPEAGPAPSPPREAPPDLASNPESTVTRVLSAFQVCSSLMVCLLLLVGEGRNVCTKTKWPSGGSFLWTVSPNPPTISCVQTRG